MPGFSKQMVAAGVLSLLGSSVHAAVLLQTDFNSAALGAYANNTTINAGGATTDNLIARMDTNSTVAIVDRGSGDRAMQFTDNGTDGGNPRAYSEVFSGVSTTDTGDNMIVGSFTYTRLLNATTSATSPTTTFAINSGGTQTTSASVTAVQVAINPNGTITYLAGTSVVNTVVTLVQDREYRFVIHADFSDLTQDQWSLEVTDLSNNTVVLAPGLVNTRAANVTPDRISFLGGGNTTGVNASPFAQIDNISFTSHPVPEPASAMVGMAGAGLLIGGRRGR